jgi:hypothetical protein
MEGKRVRCHACDDTNDQARYAFKSRIVRELLAARQDGLCTWCEEPLPEDLTSVDVDHVIPHIAGGPTVEWNMDLLHSECNHLKAAKITDRAVALAKEHGLTIKGRRTASPSVLDLSDIEDPEFRAFMEEFVVHYDDPLQVLKNMIAYKEKWDSPEGTLDS